MNYKKITSCILTAMLLYTTTVNAASEINIKKHRIYGQDRYATSIKVSREGWKFSSYVVICRGDNFADALSSVPLTKKYNAPILLIAKSDINAEIKDEIQRLKVENIIISGGERVINKKVERQLGNMSGVKNVIRLGGKDRYETSKIIAEHIGINGEVVITSGVYSSDALSISSIAAKKGMPIILTNNNKNEMQKYMKNKRIQKFFIIGGTSCVSKDIENILPNKERIYGKDRYDTNGKIIERFSNILDFENIYFAAAQSSKGDEFADALTGATLAANGGNPLVLVYKDINKDTEKIIKSNLTKDNTLIAIGGSDVVKDCLLEKISLCNKSKDIKKENVEKTNPSIRKNSSSGHSKSYKDNKEYLVNKQISFPGAFTYDFKLINKKNNEYLKGYKLIYDGDVIAEDLDNDGIVKPLTIFFGKDIDKTKFKVIKDKQEIKSIEFK